MGIVLDLFVCGRGGIMCNYTIDSFMPIVTVVCTLTIHLLFVSIHLDIMFLLYNSKSELFNFPPSLQISLYKSN